MSVVIALMVLGGFFVSALGLPLALGKVRPNPWYGFRTPRTLSDERVWYPTNRITGWYLVVTGILSGLASLVGLGFSDPDTAIYAALAGFSVPLMIGIIASIVKASAFVADLDDGEATAVSTADEAVQAAATDPQQAKAQPTRPRQTE
jgi:hypothetical protein